tara:strand:+ start:1806 stop:1991 length:186 start_codon:yes stop_codon:yes gene_type:complete
MSDELPLFDVEHHTADHHIRLYYVDQETGDRELIALFPAKKSTDRYAAGQITFFIIDYLRG